MREKGRGDDVKYTHMRKRGEYESKQLLFRVGEGRQMEGETVGFDRVRRVRCRGNWKGEC